MRYWVGKQRRQKVDIVVSFGSPFNLGSGSGINFWDDRWVGENLLKESFRMLHSLVVDPWVRVMD